MSRLGSLAATSTTWLFCAVVVFPVYWIVVTAIQPLRTSLSYPPPLFPNQPTIDGFVRLFQMHPAGYGEVVAPIQWMVNTTVAASVATVVCIALGTLGGYLLSHMTWRGHGPFGVVLLFVQVLPEVLLLVPLFALYRSLGLLSDLSWLGVATAAFSVPPTVWILRQTFERVPQPVVDAARVDGCSALDVLVRILIPVSLPGIGAASALVFFGAWNEFLFAVTFLQSAELWTVSVGMASFRASFELQVNVILASSLVFSIPPFVLFLVAQRYIVSGLTGGTRA